MGDDQMTADEARRLLAGMTTGTLEVTEIRDGRLADAGPQELAVVIHDDPRAHQRPDGMWHSVILCRGMDGPTRDANAEAFASVKRALETIAGAAAVTPDALAAIEARAAVDDQPGLDALAQAIALTGVRSVDDALAMGAAITDPNTGDVEWLMEHGCDVIDHLRIEVRRLQAQHAAEVAAAVRAETARCVAVCRARAEKRRKEAVADTIADALTAPATTGGAQ